MKADPVRERYQPWLNYCYLWLCQFPGGTKVKVGITNDPDRRAREFKTNCPFPAKGWFVCQVETKALAYSVEQEVLRTFRAYRHHGEWISVPAAKVAALVAACSRIAGGIAGESARFRPFVPRQRDVAGCRTRRKYKKKFKGGLPSAPAEEQ